MDLTGFDTYLAYSLRGAIAQAEINENSTNIGQPSSEEQDKEEIEKEA
ncbi:MAG TPA: hypothetical protein VIJ14_09830 [Rhabdochlamydiaceae bacterium]